MQKPRVQVVHLLGLSLLLLLNPGQCNPITVQCVEHSNYLSFLDEFFAQFVNLPLRIHERSIATWSYVEKIDMNRVPDKIYEANCLSSHSCRGVESSFSVESIPVSIKMPFIRLNPRCPKYSVEFEDINIACICAISRQI
ncbi:hypothetical protein DNTS_005190 [Danionella cerebrum]|uniref:Interleukin-17N n=1 Tax=Danionella cerebrum TaxID=2873325 RepID=A0A553QUD9_9TELE|nr:hypothetical protein DNTS_005190 [Danionella translucida]